MALRVFRAAIQPPHIGEDGGLRAGIRIEYPSNINGLQANWFRACAIEVYVDERGKATGFRLVGRDVERYVIGGLVEVPKDG